MSHALGGVVSTVALAEQFKCQSKGVGGLVGKGINGWMLHADRPNAITDCSDAGRLKQLTNNQQVDIYNICNPYL